MSRKELEFLEFYHEEKEFIDHLIDSSTKEFFRKIALFIKKKAEEEEKIRGEQQKREALKEEIIREMKTEERG